MSEDFARLEKLVDRMLAEHEELLQRSTALADERDRLLSERQRVSAELDQVLAKLERLDRNSP